MPFVRIDLPAGQPAEHRRRVADAVHAALTSTLGVPADDRFQVVTEHPPGALVADPGYLGIARSANAVFVQLTLNAGRSVELKRAFYRAVADGLHASAGVRREDVFINLVEVRKEDWSYGNGEAQHA
jgi:phenylpyruvate tautomerase PptA (4-oxalocrotonate tautomerase family)